MKPYWSDGRGRYATGESYDYFYMEEYEEAYKTLFTSSNGLWTYVEGEDGIELARYNGNELHVTVPSVIEGKKVTSLNSTFDGFYELKSAVIPDGVTSIEGAFYGCESLETVKLPDGLDDMTYALNCCYSLKTVKVPESVTDFSHAFEGTAIENFTFPQGTQIISNAFSGCEYLKSVTIPKSVTMSDEAFSDCEALEHVELEEGIQKLDEYAFFHCTALKELKIPESVTELGKKSVGIMETREYVSMGGYRIKGYQTVPSFQIRGIPGSTAEQYANEHGISFVEDETI